jgi:RND family efflux transporter MFP subunit
MRLKKALHRLSALTIAALALSFYAGSHAWAQDIDAMTVPKYDLKFGFAIDGRVQTMNVKPGQEVKKGDIIAELVDDEGKTMLAEYKILTESPFEVDGAKARYDLAKIELDRVRTLASKNAAAVFEVTRAEASEKVAGIEWELSKRKQLELAQQYERAKARHQEYVMRAPMDGVVEQITVEVGESVERTKPILRVVVIDPLWVNAPVPTNQTMKLKVGDSAWVTPKLEGHEQPVEGKIIWIASVADPASDTRSIRVEVPNPKRLPAGAHVGVRFTPEPTPTAATNTGSKQGSK